MKDLKTIQIPNFKTSLGHTQDIQLTYEVFGKKLHTAPIVMVNHALTGNSNVAGKTGWWNKLIGPNECIDTHKFTILAFNMPGNGYGKDGQLIFKPYAFNAFDVAKLLLLGLKQLKIIA